MMKKFLGLRAKKYSYLKDNDDEYKRAKGTKSVLWNDILSSEIIKMFQNISNWKSNKLFTKERN